MARVKREAKPYLRRLRGQDGTSSYAGELKGNLSNCLIGIVLAQTSL